MAKREITVSNKKFSINYEIINPNEKKDIIFLHGWGSNKEIMKVFQENFKNFRHIYIDLPGFGKSPNEYVLTTYDYSEIVKKFLEEINASAYIVIGHSFGGKVAALLNPELLVLLSSAGIVLPKPFKIRVKIKLFKTLNVLGLGRLRNLFVSSDAKGMSENMYETFKNVVDEDFTNFFASYKGKAIVFGGLSDTAVPPHAVKKQAELLNSENLLLNGGHYFFFNDTDAKQNRKIIEQKVLTCIK